MDAIMQWSAPALRIQYFHLCCVDRRLRLPLVPLHGMDRFGLPATGKEVPSRLIPTVLGNPM